jgi:hypothetical protein
MPMVAVRRSSSPGTTTWMHRSPLLSMIRDTSRLAFRAGSRVSTLPAGSFVCSALLTARKMPIGSNFPAEVGRRGSRGSRAAHGPTTRLIALDREVVVGDCGFVARADSNVVEAVHIDIVDDLFVPLALPPYAGGPRLVLNP